MCDFSERRKSQSQSKLFLRSLVPFFLPCHLWSALKISLGHIVGNLSDFGCTLLSSAVQYCTKLIQRNTANPIYIVRVGILTGSLTPLVPWARLVNFFPRVCQPVRRGCAFIPAPDTTFLNEQSTALTALVVGAESRRLCFLSEKFNLLRLRAVAIMPRHRESKPFRLINMTARFITFL
jgi:hypothetical protein